ncbi:energy-coupling factor ABC transporter substrate-binding protein [Methanolobus psychrotolerans]|uniref:energy-coupling factor ABC transporter substrate-binding protein n=1 Tax=Methanolobus psychrotolerans TaxID=1874706 RepID=UPI000B915B79|nr:energy-coupling factor ABC transporter substrate-binding protein [Methanolobus psychrotolerans]
MKLEYIVGIIVLLFAAQFFYGVAANPGSEFGGADGAAGDVVAEINPEYEPMEPWFADYMFEPPGGETESLLFALQAAFGSIVIGYTIGYYKGKSKSN